MEASDTLEPKGSTRLQLTLPSDTEFIDLLRTATSTFLSRIPGGAELVSRVELPLVEAFVNAVTHAHAGQLELPVEVEIAHDPPYLVAWVRDRGAPFAPPAPDPAERRMAEHGRGLLLIRQMVDQLAIDSRSSGNTITMTWKIPLEESTGP